MHLATIFKFMITKHRQCTKFIVVTRTIMKTRKRALSCASNAAPAGGLPLQIEQRPPLCSTPCLAELKQHSFTTGILPASSAATLLLAVKAFQGQLEVCSKQPHSDLAGYRSFPQKQRLEYRMGDAVLGDLGVLNHLANTVPMLTTNNNCHTYNANTFLPIFSTQVCYRWCKPWISSPRMLCHIWQ